MPFRIFTDISTANVVTVQTDTNLTFEGVPQNPNQARAVNLNFVNVHVSGAGIAQSPIVNDFVNAQLFRVSLRGSTVTILPVPNPNAGGPPS